MLQYLVLYIHVFEANDGRSKVQIAGSFFEFMKAI